MGMFFLFLICSQCMFCNQHHTRKISLVSRFPMMVSYDIRYTRCKLVLTNQIKSLNSACFWSRHSCAFQGWAAKVMDHNTFAGTILQKHSWSWWRTTRGLVQYDRNTRVRDGGQHVDWYNTTAAPVAVMDDNTWTGTILQKYSCPWWRTTRGLVQYCRSTLGRDGWTHVELAECTYGSCCLIYIFILWKDYIARKAHPIYFFWSTYSYTWKLLHIGSYW